MAPRQASKVRRGRDRPRARSRRDEILEAARSIIQRNGLSEVTALGVAADVPISEASVFYHFPTKDVLLAETALSVLAEESRTLTALAEGAASGVDAVASVIRGRLAFYRDRPKLVELVHVHGLSRMTEEQRERAIELVNCVFDAIEACFGRARPSKRLRRRIGSVWLLSEGLLQLEHHVAAEILTTKENRVAILDDALALAREGLRDI